ncbi:MAG: glycosyltransferase family 4 protein, partial [Acidobacteriota bacterium]
MRILFVTPRPPWPGRRGDQVRVAGWVRGLATAHDVHLLSQRWPGQDAAPAPFAVGGAEVVDIGRPQLALAGARAAWSGVSGRGRSPLQSLLYAHRSFRRAALRSVRRLAPDVVVVVLSRLGDLAEGLGDAGVPVVVDLVDALGANMERRAERERWLSPLWRREARRLFDWDRRLVGRVAAATVVAERDRRAILAPGPGAPGPPRTPDGAEEARDLAATLRVMPFGLDVPPPAPRSAVDETVVLTGNLGYFPTVEGARWFAAAVWPRIRRRRPRARWVLAGSRPAPAIRAAASSEGVELVEHPPDLGVYLAAARVAIAPLRAGSGTPIKILEAMSRDVPVVSTSAGRDGLDGLPKGALAVADAAAD